MHLKILRLAEHIEWAAQRGSLEAVGKFLRGLREDDWLHIGECECRASNAPSALTIPARRRASLKGLRVYLAEGDAPWAIFCRHPPPPQLAGQAGSTRSLTSVRKKGLGAVGGCILTSVEGSDSSLARPVSALGQKLKGS